MKKKIVIVIFMFIMFFVSYLAFDFFQEDTIVLEIGIYSGNEWGVPQIDVYKIYDEAIQLFELKYDNVEVIYRSGTLMEDYSEWLAQKVLKGNEPDVFIVLQEDFNTFSEIGMLEPLSQYIKEEPEFDKNDYYEKALEVGKYNNEQFAIPFEIVPTFMIVNRSLLVKNRLSIPEDQWTLNSFMTISKQLTKDVDNDNIIDQFGSVGYEWDHVYYAENGDFSYGNRAVEIYDENKLKNAIDYTKSLYQLNKGYIVSNKEFSEGLVGFKPFSLAEFRAYKPYPYKVKKYSNFNWGAIPFPVKEDNQSQAKLYTVQLGMSSRTKEKDLSWEFIRFMSSNEIVQQMVWDYTYALPTKISVVNTIYDQHNKSDDILDPEFLKLIIEQSVVEPTFKKYNQIREAMDIRIKVNLLEEKSTQDTIRQVRKDVEDILFDID